MILNSPLCILWCLLDIWFSCFELVDLSQVSLSECVRPNKATSISSNTTMRVWNQIYIGKRSRFCPVLCQIGVNTLERSVQYFCLPSYFHFHFTCLLETRCPTCSNPLFASDYWQKTARQICKKKERNRWKFTTHLKAYEDMQCNARSKVGRNECWL